MKIPHTKIIIPILLHILILSSNLTQAAPITALTSSSTIILQKINEARANPTLTLNRLAIPVSQAAAILANDAWLLNQGLPPLTWNKQITTAATTHGHDMLQNGYYSYTSPAGQTPTTRITAAGYNPLAADETLASLNFTNYLAPDTAITSLIDQMLYDELTGVAGVGRNIFSATLTEIGIAMFAQSGAMSAMNGNKYLLVLDFAIPADTTAVPNSTIDLTDATYLLWQKINEARANPRLVLTRLGLSETVVTANLADNAWILAQSLPPLALSGKLQTTATYHNREMFNNVYYSHNSIAGLGPAERVAENGYEAFEVAETLAAKLLDNSSNPDIVIDEMLDGLLFDELMGPAGSERNIFSVWCTEIGLNLQAQHIAALPGNPLVYLMVMNVAQPLVPRSFVLGAVNPGQILMQHNLTTGFWDIVPTLPSGLFQQSLDQNIEIVSYDSMNNRVAEFRPTTLAPQGNYFADLRP